MASRSLDDLLPQVREKALQLDEDCRDENIILLFTCTWRSPEEQDALYAQAHDGIDNDHDGQIDEANECVTHAKAWESWHQTRRAFDVVPKIPNHPDGSPFWNHIPTCAKLHSNKPCNCGFDRVWAKVGTIGKACGLAWGGDWPPKKRDRPHFQYTEGLTLAEAREQLEQRDAQADGIKQ